MTHATEKYVYAESLAKAKLYTFEPFSMIVVDDTNEVYFNDETPNNELLNMILVGGLINGSTIKLGGKELNVDLSNLITYELYASLSSIVQNTITKDTLATINGQSIEKGGNISIDLSLYKVVLELPTENILNNKIYLLFNKNSTDNKNSFDEYIYNDTTDTPQWELLGQFNTEIDLSGYLTKEEAATKYMAKGSQTTSGGGNSDSSLSISLTGAFNNYGNNGLAFNAVRDLSKVTPVKYNTLTGSGYPLNAASFGVKDNGTTAFSHKKYDTFNKDTGAYTGAKNTAVLCFSGKSGLLYAKNTGSSNDVTDDMYKRVGVIDSPDEKQRVYSAEQVDEIISGLLELIDELKRLLNS